MIVLVAVIPQLMVDPGATEINMKVRMRCSQRHKRSRGRRSIGDSNRGMVHFVIGQSDYPTPQHSKDAGAEASADGKTTYTTPQGLLELCENLGGHVQICVCTCVAQRGVRWSWL